MCSGFKGSRRQRIGAKVDHSRGQIIAGIPVCIGLSQLVGGKRRGGAAETSVVPAILFSGIQGDSSIREDDLFSRILL